MSNDLYKHHATDPGKEMTNTKIREIKMIFSGNPSVWEKPS